MADGDAKPGRDAQRFGQGFLTDIWYFAALAADLRRGRMLRLELMGEPVVLGRTDGGEAFALHDVCPHRAAPLSAGRLAGDAVTCPYHGWVFGADGACRAIPSLGESQSLDVSRIRVRRYPLAESQGLVFIWAGSRADSEPDHPPPAFPGVVGGPPKLVDRMAFDAHIDHAVVGLMDPAHGPYVHQQWWWRSARSQHQKEKRFEPREAGFAMVRHAPSKNSRAYAILGGQPLTEITFRIPGYRWEHVTVGRRQVLSLTCLTPESARRTGITQIVWSDHPVFGVLKPLIAAGARAFLRQDAGMVNLQARGLQTNPALMWIDDADRQAKWYQQLKREWAASRREGRGFVNPVQAATLRWRS